MNLIEALRHRETGFARRLVRTAVLLLLLFLGVLAVYGQTGSFLFIDYDDPGYVLENAAVRNGLTVEGARWAFTTFHESNWHPLTWLSHMLDIEMAGLSPRQPHLVNAGFHALSTLLLYLLLRGLTGALGPSLAAATFFGVHPLRAESVAWVSERKDVLAAFFFMLTLLAWSAYARAGRPSATPVAAGGPGPGQRVRCGWTGRRSRYLLALLFYALGLLSKPTLAPLPLVLLLLDWWPLGRILPGPPHWWRRILPLLREKVPFFLLALGSAAVTVAAQAANRSLGPLEEYPPPTRLANALVSAVAYLGSAVVPTNLSPFYPYPLGGVPPWRWIVAALVIFFLAVAAWRLSRRHPAVPVGLLWYLAMLLPMLGIVQVGFQARADRYTYLPLIGFSVALFWLAAAILARLPRARLPVLAAVFLGLVLLAVAGHRQVSFWRDHLTIFTRAAAVGPENWKVSLHLGHALADLGRPDEALPHLRRSVELFPGNAVAWNDLGMALARSGQLEEALRSYREALRRDPGEGAAAVNLGMLLAFMGRRTEALGVYRLLEREDAEAAARLAPFLSGS